jgi:hypothetical protein
MTIADKDRERAHEFLKVIGRSFTRNYLESDEGWSELKRRLAAAFADAGKCYACPDRAVSCHECNEDGYAAGKAEAREQGRREGLEEAVKAECYRCRFGAPFEEIPDNAIPGIIPTYHLEHRTAELHGLLLPGPCDAVGVRSLLASRTPEEK